MSACHVLLTVVPEHLVWTQISEQSLRQAYFICPVSGSFCHNNAIKHCKNQGLRKTIVYSSSEYSCYVGQLRMSQVGLAPGCSLVPLCSICFSSCLDQSWRFYSILSIFFWHCFKQITLPLDSAHFILHAVNKVISLISRHYHSTPLNLLMTSFCVWDAFKHFSRYARPLWFDISSSSSPSTEYPSTANGLFLILILAF